MSDPTTNHQAQPTGAGVMQFLDYAMEKGYLKTPTGQAMKTAVKEVLSSTEGEDTWESVDIDSLDLDDICSRFETLRAMKFSSGSLKTYQSRFTKSVKMFQEFRKNPGGWRPDVKQRASRSKSNGSQTPDDNTPQAPDTPAPQLAPKANMITYPFPVRDGVLASIGLPADLTKREAKRLCSFIDSVAIEEQGQLPPGPPANPVGDN